MSVQQARTTKGIGGFGMRAAWAWAVASLVMYLIAPFVALVVLAPQGQQLPPSGLAILPVAWTWFAAFGAVVAARLCLGAWPRVGFAAVAVLVVGGALAGWVDASLHAWSGQRFGYFEPDLIGPSSVFFAVVVGTAVGAFGVLIAPKRAALPPTLAVLAGVVLTVIILVGNVPGLADGLDPESVPLAAAIALASLYVIAIGVLVLQVWQRTWAD
jgi:hypothetical protein